MERSKHKNYVEGHENNITQPKTDKWLIREGGEQELKKDRNLKEIQKSSSQRLSLKHFYTFFLSYNMTTNTTSCK